LLLNLGRERGPGPPSAAKRVEVRRAIAPIG